MRARIGLDLGGDRVRAVLVRGGSVRWAHEEKVGLTEALADVIERALAAAPRSRFGRPKVGVIVGPGRSQVRRLEGLPALPSRKLVTQLVRENANAFFLRTGGRLAIPDVHRSDDGTCWGAAIDRAAIDEIVGGATTAGFSVVAIAPSASPVVHAPGADVAHAAALLSARSALSWQPEMSGSRSAALRRVRIAACMAALIVSGAAALAAPAIRSTLYHRDASVELSRLRSVELEAAHATAELRRVTQILDGVAAFEMERGHVTRLLGDLSQAIPESTAIVTFRIDSLEGSFVAIAPHVMDLLPELGGVHEMSTARIAGSVTREVLAGTRLERATFRFRRPRSGSRAPGPAPAPASGAKQ